MCLAALQVFKGVWRMQDADRGGKTCRLSYCLFVRPQVCPASCVALMWRVFPKQQPTPTIGRCRRFGACQEAQVVC